MLKARESAAPGYYSVGFENKMTAPFVNRIYKNQPQAYIRTMDDDAGAMSSWFVLTAAGISPAHVGWPVYYLNVPLFESLKFNWDNGKTLEINVKIFR